MLPVTDIYIDIEQDSISTIQHSNPVSLSPFLRHGMTTCGLQESLFSRHRLHHTINPTLGVHIHFRWGKILTELSIKGPVIVSF